MTPTRVRFGVIAATTLVAVMLYLDRACLGILSEQIEPLLDPEPEVQAVLFGDLSSAFFLTNALFNCRPGGSGRGRCCRCTWSCGRPAPG